MVRGMLRTLHGTLSISLLFPFLLVHTAPNLKAMIPNPEVIFTNSALTVSPKTPSPRPQALKILILFAAQEHLSMLRGQGGIDGESPVDGCVLAFFSLVTGAVRNQGCSRGSCVAVLRGLRGMLLDNGYIGQFLVER